jgi:23S rRNA (cytidine1920-2'-O)/16S rRNA (cytidine1409-2'-O)-methyltransferase
LDAEMVRRGLAPSRTAAQALIAARQVRVAGLPEPKAASQVGPDQPIAVDDDVERYASRGGGKLAGALDDLGVDVAGRTCLDAGAAHGGFTDVLLRRGAAHVIAVDVAYGQLAHGLRTDPRVTVLERTNVRHLAVDALGGRRPDLVTADLSFISLRAVLPALAAICAPAATVLPMVKPQFEAGPAAVGRGGVVRDPATWRRVLEEVVEAAAGVELGLVGAAPSRLPGPAGNVEFFLHLQRPRPAAGRATAEVLEAAVDRGLAVAAGGAGAT